jgi:hypothetical protein
LMLLGLSLPVPSQTRPCSVVASCGISTPCISKVQHRMTLIKQANEIVFVCRKRSEIPSQIRTANMFSDVRRSLKSAVAIQTRPATLQTRPVSGCVRSGPTRSEFMMNECYFSSAGVARLCDGPGCVHALELVNYRGTAGDV